MTKRNRARPPRWRTLATITALTLALCAYLFATAPAPLAAESTSAAGALPIDRVFAVLDRENAAARAIWTEDIVTAGQAAGLAFDERWRDPGLAAGPLPALFLRETARELERTGLGLGLFLGSPYPIRRENLLTGQQAAQFTALTGDGAPRYFVEPHTLQHTAMFADRAVAAGCVSCHNKHPASPKTDWKLGAIMGATTWTYRDGAVSAERALALVHALRTSIRGAYTAYLEKVVTFPHPPEIGMRWPRDGYYLPSVDEFMRALEARTSAATLAAITDPARPLEALPAAPPPSSAPPSKHAAAATAVDRTPLLVVRARATALVNVERAGHRVLYARLPAGATTSLRAQPPLRIQIPDPGDVELEYAGARVALPHDQEADFVLGGPDFQPIAGW